MAVGVGILVVFPIGNTKEGGKSPCGRRSGCAPQERGRRGAGSGEQRAEGSAKPAGLKTLPTSKASSSGT